MNNTVTIPPNLRDKSPEELASMMPPIFLKFADFIANGTNKAEAYRKIRPHIQKQCANRLGHRLAARPIVLTYVDKIKARLANRSILSSEERRELLTRVARGEVVTDRVVTRTAEDGTVDVTEHSMSRERAIKLDAELSGELSGTQVNVGIDFTSMMAKLGDDVPFVDVQHVTPAIESDTST